MFKFNVVFSFSLLIVNKTRQSLLALLYGYREKHGGYNPLSISLKGKKKFSSQFKKRYHVKFVGYKKK